MQLGGLVASAGINIGLVILFLALYSVFRNRPTNANVYFPRYVLRERNVLKKDTFTLASLVPSAGWIQRALNPSEDEIIASSGLDAVVLLRMFIFSMRFFAICTLIGIGILAPLNYTDNQATHESKSDVFFDSLDLFTISNISDGSNRLWVHLIAVYVISFSAYWLLYVEYKHVSDKRLQVLAEARPQPDQFTVLVHHIPRKENKSCSEVLEEFFKEFHPNTYFMHHIVYDDWKVQKMKRRFEKLVKQIETLKQQPRSKRLTACFGFFTRKHDPLEQKVKDVDHLYHEIRQAQSRLQHDEKAATSSAFVSFRTRWGAAICAQSQQSENPLALSTQWAPEPRDVYWPNLHMPFLLSKLYELGVNVLVFAIIVLYTVPVALVQTVAQLNSLRKLFPPIDVFLKIPGVKPVITGYLPSLLLSLLLYLIPSLMLFLSKIQGHGSYSSQEKEAVRKVYWFLVGHVFFVTVLSGSLLEHINSILGNPKSIPNELAYAVPAQSTFFSTYILTTGWTGFSMEILQLGTLVLNMFKVRLFGKVGLDAEDAIPPPYYRFIPNVCLFILIGLMYAVLAPLLLPFLLIFFVFGFVVYRNQVLYVYEPGYESIGCFWPDIHGNIIFAMILMQIMFIGVFSVKSKPVASVISLPLPFLTLFFNNYCRNRFLPIFQNLSMETAMKKDITDDRSGLRDGVLDTLPTAYKHPALQPVTQQSNVNTELLLPAEP